VSYDARGSSDPDGDSLTYRWQFGDGSAEVQGFAAQHRYIDQGKFSITLIVTDSHGATDQAHWAIEIWNVAPSVTPSLTVPPMPAPLPLQAKISPHAFDVGPADNPVATIDWGDGTVSKDTVHTYTKPGAYVVQVTATDKDGATSQPWMSGALWVYDASASHPTAPGYESIDLGTLGGDAFPRALNNRGEVVGSGAASSTQGWVHHGFFWKDGVLTDLGPSGSSRGHADAINEAGWIAGGSGQGDPNMALWNEGVPAGSNYVGAGEYGVWVVKLTEAKDAVANVEGHEYPRAYLVRNGSSTDLGNLGAYFAYGRDMNSLWQVVGEAAVKYVGAEAYEWHAFLWENGVMKDLGSLGTTPCPYNPQDLCSYSEALDINERGQIVGDAENSSGVMRAVIWDPNTTTPRDLGFGSGSSRAVKINERGQIAGDGSGEGYFLDGVELIRLGSLGGGKTSVAGMNESGMVIGTSATSAGEIHAFIWSRGSGMRDLGTGPFGAARVGSTAVAINERGDVVGVAAPCLYQYDFSCSVWSPARPILWRNHN
jgi:probable HAF family extracellular repeat protein